MNTKNLQRQSKRGAFTLIELLVVLLILVALAGVLIPIFPSFLREAHTATTAGSIAETVNNLQLYRVKYNALPDRLDSLVVTGTTVIPYLPGTLNTLVTASPAADAAALNAAGIKNVFTHFPNNMAPEFNATFNNQSPATPVQLTTTTNLISIAGNAPEIATLFDPPLQTVGDNPAENTFYLFGIGNNNSAIGLTMTDAPVHFPEEDNPNQVYSRYILVVRVSGEATERLVDIAGVYAAHDTEFEGLGPHQAEYFGTRIAP